MSLNNYTQTHWPEVAYLETPRPRGRTPTLTKDKRGAIHEIAAWDEKFQSDQSNGV